MNKEQKVHLDHLITRQNIRYAPSQDAKTEPNQNHKPDNSIRFSDIQQKDGWFSNLAKPDFQRATCAWTSEGCVNFLSSVIRQRIIPSIILWKSNDTGLVYVLDGAHRLSVLRAWMLDDWGDKANDFYKKNENYEEIITAAQDTRQLISGTIGAFSDFEDASKELRKLNSEGEAPRQKMSPQRFEMAQFYNDIVFSSRTLHAQWESGDYRAAEESFLAINRQGVPLDDLESTLIEFRNGSYSRLIMSIASSGASGHYWPEPSSQDKLSTELQDSIRDFSPRCEAIHNLLFVPPFDSKILEINVPFMVSPGHFRKHQHLIEILPLLSNDTTINKESLNSILSSDHNSPAQDVITNAQKTLSKIEEKLSHLGSIRNSPNSISLAPLVYWYNKQGNYVRGLFYGFCHWMLSGSDTDIKNRKIIYSTVRGRFEEALIEYKDEFSDIQHKGGAGLKSIGKISSTLQELTRILIENPEYEANKKLEILFGKTKKPTKSSTSRSFTTKNKAEINIREMLKSAIKCEICGGIVDLKQDIQYDHINHYSKSKDSTPKNGRPTHPFCNLFREKISATTVQPDLIQLPPLKSELVTSGIKSQLDLFDLFPGL
ncbi:DUF262 domain-containing protein [Pseudomonas sp. SG20056]|uniref:GmrSD restriction endonuclease domain-containing protein n=1 Tax=Pseudomonas sp. SG20056 TaxID=3074146 RepID=UPI00287F3F98|nr:DUF262 domain-containing protein [Pseudomonas sp. SG20056]WNF48066.1 DUF262 domain-containing protein [Pseudomonas sp. SG20056]